MLEIKPVREQTYDELKERRLGNISLGLKSLWKRMAPMVSETAKRRMWITYDQEVQWMTGRESWERALVDSQKARRSLLDEWAKGDKDLEFLQSLQELWVKMRFDSVVPGWIVVHGVAIPCEHTLNRKEESDPQAPQADLGRQDVTVRDMKGLQWEPKKESAVSVRGKIDGIPFVKVDDGGESYLQGSWKIKVPNYFPVRKAEFFSGEFYIVYPYAVPGFVYTDPETREEWKFRSHPWCHPVDFRDSYKYDGIMVLIGDVEKRAKRFPSTEIYWKSEVWEVRFGSSYGNVIPLRPRPGKVARSIGASVFRVPMSTILSTFPSEKYYRIIEVMSGPVEVNFTRRKTNGRFDTIVLDSSLRYNQDLGMPVSSYRQLQSVDPQYYDYCLSRTSLSVMQEVNSGKAISIESPGSTSIRAFIGSKIVVYGDDSYWMILDETGKKVKPPDWIGGLMEGGESSRECAIREIFEETRRQVKVKSSDLIAIGFSDANDPGEFARSYVFAYNLKKNDPLKPFLMPFVEQNMSQYQPWVSRIWQYFNARVGRGYASSLFLEGRVRRLIEDGMGPVARTMVQLHNTSCPKDILSDVSRLTQEGALPIEELALLLKKLNYEDSEIAGFVVSKIPLGNFIKHTPLNSYVEAEYGQVAWNSAKKDCPHVNCDCILSFYGSRPPFKDRVIHSSSGTLNDKVYTLLAEMSKNTQWKDGQVVWKAPEFF